MKERNSGHWFILNNDTKAKRYREAGTRSGKLSERSFGRIKPQETVLI